ncbi:MAG: pteridine reductase [Acidiferrobacter sp.]
MQVEERVVLVTGGARRVGAAIVRALHARGLAIVLHHRSAGAEAQALKAELEAQRPHSVALAPADLLAPAAPATLVATALAAFGRLDMIVNNASSFYPTPMPTATTRDWDDLIGTNLKAPFFVIQAARPALVRRGGAVVNIVDIHAERPLKGYPVYSIAKAGLVMLTKALARELAPTVRVNAIAPGTILWPEHGVDDHQKREILARIPQRQSGDPTDIAGACAFLLLDASYVTGQVLAVDGGRSIVL